MPSMARAMGSSSLRASATLLLLAVAAVVVAVGSSARSGGGGVVDTVADSCNAIRDFVEVAFCEAALRSSGPGAATADRHGHLLIAADLAAARGDSARDAVAAALASGGDAGGERDGLEACGILYGSSVPAVRLMRGYAAARSWEAARSLLWLSGQAGMGCAAALDAPAAAAAGMDRANEDFSRLTTMATALLNSVTASG